MENREVRPATGASFTRFLVVMAIALGGVLLIVWPYKPMENAQPEVNAVEPQPAARAEARPPDTISVRFEGIKAETKEQRITKEEIGEKWPLTVEDATVSCVPQFSKVNGGTFLIADGRAFALTGSTQTMVRARQGEVTVVGGGLGRQTPALFTGDDPHSDRLWLKMPDQGDGLSWRVNISPVLDAAISLCKE